jgi:SagB-type dehydrogenase family enzyme
MTTTRFTTALLVFAVSLPLLGETILLPPPDTEGGAPLMKAIQQRRSTREFSPKALSNQTIANILWAAYGVNRAKKEGRTVPAAWGMYEMDLYVFTPDGVNQYLPVSHAMKQVLKGDQRKSAGAAEFAAVAPLSLVYVADHNRSLNTTIWEKESYAYMHTGFIGQNVYLYAASEGLGCVIHDSANKGALADSLGLSKSRQVIISQTVGYPAE